MEFNRSKMLMPLPLLSLSILAAHLHWRLSGCLLSPVRCIFVFLSFCLFVFSSFGLFAPLSFCPALYLIVHLSSYLSIFIYWNLETFWVLCIVFSYFCFLSFLIVVFVFLCPFVFLPFCLFLSFRLFIYSPFCQFVFLSFPPFCLFVSLYWGLPVYSPSCLFIFQSFGLCMFVFLCRSVCLSLSLSLFIFVYLRSFKIVLILQSHFVPFWGVEEI